MPEQSQTENTAKSPAINNVILLKCQIRRPFIDVDQFQIHVSCCEESTEPTMLDQMVVIALQAFEENEVQMQMKESSSSKLWNNRKRHESAQLWKSMIASLANSSIAALEAFCVWMQFWQAQGLWKESFQWNASVLVGQSKGACSDLNTQQIASESASTITPQEELWIECLAHQLPRIQDHKLAVELMSLLEKILRNGHHQDTQSSDESPQTLDWDKMEQQLNKHLLAVRMGDQPHIKTIRSLQDSWVWGKFDFIQDETTSSDSTSSRLTSEPLSPTAMKTIRKAWKASLETINRLDQGDQSDDCHANEADNKAMGSHSEYLFATLLSSATKSKVVDLV